MSLFAEVDRLKVELDALRPLSPEQEASILQKFRLDWNYNSNAIEGNSLTLGETRSLLLHGLTAAGKPIRDHLDIKGHNEAVVWLEEVVRNEQPLTGHFIREMHQVLLGEPYEVKAQTPDGQSTFKTIHPGQYKSSPNNVLTATGEMFYFASPEETPAKMTDLVDWYRQEAERPTLHPVALAAEFHYRFVRIHPFDDGNGRMSRLLMNLILMRSGYPMTVIKAADRNRYLSVLAEADADEIEPFYRFISENVEFSLQLMIRAAKGESIDEPDDLDKKLALLKKQVLSREDTIQTTWNNKTQSEFYAALLEFWFNNVAQEMERFNELFFSSRVSVSYHKVNEQYYGGSPAKTLSEALKDAKNYLSKPEVKLDQVTLVFEWTTFRIARNPFDIRLLIDFNFSKFDFEVGYRLFEPIDFSSMAPQESILTKYVYKTSYDHLRIKEINRQLANKVYDFIAVRVAKADIPIE